MHALRPSLETPSHLTQKGFTAIELMVVVSIVAILTALAAPSFTPLFERWRVRSAADELTSTIYYVRSEAIKRGGGLTIEALGGWGDGWRVVHTRGGVAANRQTSPAASKVAMTQSSATSTLYADRWGMISETSGGAPTVGMNLLLHPTGKSTTDASAIRLCIAGSGRVAQVKQGASCP